MNSGNMLSLFETKEMAKGIIRSEPIATAGFHLGQMGATYFVWGTKFHKNLKASNFDQAMKEMLEVVQNECVRRNLPIPSKLA